MLYTIPPRFLIFEFLSTYNLMCHLLRRILGRSCTNCSRDGCKQAFPKGSTTIIISYSSLHDEKNKRSKLAPMLFFNAAALAADCNFHASLSCLYPFNGFFFSFFALFELFQAVAKVVPTTPVVGVISTCFLVASAVAQVQCYICM